MKRTHLTGIKQIDDMRNNFSDYNWNEIIQCKNTKSYNEFVQWMIQTYNIYISSGPLNILSFEERLVWYEEHPSIIDWIKKNPDEVISETYKNDMERL